MKLQSWRYKDVSKYKNSMFPQYDDDLRTAELGEEVERLRQENKKLKEEIQVLKDYIQDKDNRINHPLKRDKTPLRCLFFKEK